MTKSLIKLTASIVLFNSDLKGLKDLLHDLTNSYPEVFVYVLDNSETNLSEAFRGIDNLEYIFNNTNLGYGKAHNIGIDKAYKKGSKFHMVINPDIRIDEETIRRLISFMDNNHDVGLCAPKVLYPSGELQHLCKLIPSPKNLFIRRFLPIKKIVENNDNRYELRYFDYNHEIEIPYASGCFMFIRTDLINSIGGFDERFFLYFEDLDLTRRIRRLAKVVFYPKAVVYHGYNKESYRNNKVLFYHIVSALKYFNKWGWFFDSERMKLNKETVLQLNYKK
ncbi:glycosyltransferase family 2 protein [Tenacibaculum xiamenense]|uniref:glycosyltransferase family 2 protein n=1 Tax=Tenacibaculum xiamenense TaxID=1261553 RepID=UPI0038945077